MYKSAVMVSGRCLLKIHQNQNAFIDQWSKGRCLQDFCVHLGGQKVPPLPEPGCWCFFLVRCTEHNKTKWFAESLCFSMNFLGAQLF